MKNEEVPHACRTTVVVKVQFTLLQAILLNFSILPNGATVSPVELPYTEILISRRPQGGSILERHFLGGRNF